MVIVTDQELSSVWNLKIADLQSLAVYQRWSLKFHWRYLNCLLYFLLKDINQNNQNTLMDPHGNLLLLLLKMIIYSWFTSYRWWFSSSLCQRLPGRVHLSKVAGHLLQSLSVLLLDHPLLGMMSEKVLSDIRSIIDHPRSIIPDCLMEYPVLDIFGSSFWIFWSFFTSCSIRYLRYQNLYISKNSIPH